MNKKVITITIIVAVLIISAVGYFLFLNRGGSVGIDEAIQNENGKQSAGNVDLGDKKVLVVYFSETGNTQKLAKLISDEVGGDFRRIEPKTPYTTNHSDLVSIAKEEQNKDLRPEIKNRISDFNDYDIIYVGYPIWWSDMPQILYTFFELYDFSGKTVIPFSTHGGSGLAGTVNKLKTN